MRFPAVYECKILAELNSRIRNYVMNVIALNALKILRKIFEYQLKIVYTFPKVK